MSKKDIKYWVNVEEYVYGIRDRDPDDSWDRGDEGLNAILTSIARSEHSMWDCVWDKWDCPYGIDDIDIGKIAQVVFVEYTTGDTFGSSGAWCIAAIKEDPQEALKIQDLCDKPSDKHRPWDGYFEYLNSVEVVSLIVGA